MKAKVNYIEVTRNENKLTTSRQVWNDEYVDELEKFYRSTVTIHTNEGSLVFENVDVINVEDTINANIVFGDKPNTYIINLFGNETIIDGRDYSTIIIKDTNQTEALSKLQRGLEALSKLQ